MYDSALLNAYLNFANTVLRINVNTNEVHPLKLNGELIEDPDFVIDGSILLEKYKQTGQIYSNDLWQIELLADRKYVAYECKQNISTSLIFRQCTDNHIIWYRVDIFLASDYSDSNPNMFLVSHQLAEKEAFFFDSYSVLSQRFHKILFVNLKENTSHIIKETAAEESVRAKQDANGFPSIQDFSQHGYVYPEDIPSFHRHMNPEYIKEYFASGNPYMLFYYRRMIGGLFRWVKLSIIPSVTYNIDNPVFYYYIEDVHKTVLKTLDMNAATQYAKFFGNLPSTNVDSYYENLLSVLNGFTQKYIDFYMIDLEKDLFIKYKITSGILPELSNPIGAYTQSSEEYIKKFCTSEQAKVLSQYSSSDKLRELMKNRLVLEYDFDSIDGRKVRTICEKIESVRGIPVKLLCRTIEVMPEKKLLVRTFGNFEVFDEKGNPFKFSRKQSKQLFAYLVDRQGFPVTSKDIVIDVLEKSVDDLNAIKYVSTMIRRLINDLEASGYPNVVIKEQKSVHIDTKMIDCDYYHLLQGDFSYLLQYHNEYMKEYSWAESTNAEILSMVDK